MDDLEIRVLNGPAYEKVNLARKIFNRLVTGAFSLLPFSVAKLLIRSSSKNAAVVHNNITTHEALDALYTTGVKFNFRINLLNEIIEHIWFNLNNPKAVRNRLKLVTGLLSEIMNAKSKNKDLLVASLASGSARAVIDVLSGLENDQNIELLLLDRNKKALEKSARIMKEKNLNIKKHRLINDNVRNFTDYCHNKNPDIIEMVGLLDYLDDNKSNLIIAKIYNTLTPGGVFITANIRNNQERSFLENALKWRMVYREPQELLEILLAAGFKKQNIKIYSEPLLIHTVAVATK